MKKFADSVAMILLPLVLSISACAKTSGSSGPDGWDDAGAAAQVNASLKGRYFEIPFPHSRHNCTEYFTVGETTILDVSESSTPPGATSATVMVKTSTRVQAIQSVNGDSFAGLNCYGNPYAAGQAANFIQTFQFQKWRSGWQLQ